MLPFSDVNLLAVLIAALAAFIIGYFWYGPIFGKAWMKELGLSDKGKPEHAGKSIAQGALNMLITAYVLGLLLVLIAPSSLGDALAFGVAAWLGLKATTEASSVIWEKRTLKLFLINQVYELFAVLIMVTIFMSWPA